MHPWIPRGDGSAIAASLAPRREVVVQVDEPLDPDRVVVVPVDGTFERRQRWPGNIHDVKNDAGLLTAMCLVCHNLTSMIADGRAVRSIGI